MPVNVWFSYVIVRKLNVHIGPAWYLTPRPVVVVDEFSVMLGQSRHVGVQGADDSESSRGSGTDPDMPGLEGADDDSGSRRGSDGRG